MHFRPKSKDPSGFALVEGLLIVVIIAAIVGIGAYVMHQKDKANTNLSSTTPAISNTAAQGTTASISQITGQDSQIETSADTAADSQGQTNIDNANAQASSVVGAYDENNL